MRIRSTAAWLTMLLGCAASGGGCTSHDKYAVDLRELQRKTDDVLARVRQPEEPTLIPYEHGKSPGAVVQLVGTQTAEIRVHRSGWFDRRSKWDWKHAGAAGSFEFEPLGLSPDGRRVRVRIKDPTQELGVSENAIVTELDDNDQPVQHNGKDLVGSIWIQWTP